jgi:rhodanese-related sulfurtransferase
LLTPASVPIAGATAATLVHDHGVTTVDGVDALLRRARAGVRRLDPHETRAAVAAGALLIDTRTDRQRARQGELPGAIVIDRTVLEWRLDPRSSSRIPEATGHDVPIVVVCRQGYSSSLAAAGLRAIGLHRATDLVGGVEAWLAAGLPTTTEAADVRE